MHIVIEGPDNSGKSTLALALAMTTGRDIVRSEGPPQHPGEINQRVVRYSKMRDKIFDRHPCVSNLIYDKFRDAVDPIPPEFINSFYDANPLIIYCRGRGLDEHIVKEHDSEKHKVMVEIYHRSICNAYDEWALQHAQVFYRIGDDMRRLMSMLSRFDPVADIEAFHEKFGIAYSGKPRMLEGELRRFREGFLVEECEEYTNWNNQAASELLIKSQEALHFDAGNFLIAMEGSFDSLIDLVYVALGTAHVHGFNFREGWRRVHEANMRKIGGPPCLDPSKGVKWGVIKPIGWEAPRLVDLIEDHAHR